MIRTKLPKSKTNPRIAINKQCLKCISSSSSYSTVRKCGGDKIFERVGKNCALFSVRLKSKDTPPDKELLKAIRQQCLFCRNKNMKAIKYCKTQSCLLHPFRSGHIRPIAVR